MKREIEMWDMEASEMWTYNVLYKKMARKRKVKVVNDLEHMAHACTTKQATQLLEICLIGK